jgi:hypothetical protein
MTGKNLVRRVFHIVMLSYSHLGNQTYDYTLHCLSAVVQFCKHARVKFQTINLKPGLFGS